MDKNLAFITVLGLVFLVGVAYNLNTANFPFVAVSSGKYLGQVSNDESPLVFEFKVVLSSDSAPVRGARYTVDIWGPEADSYCYSTPAWHSSGTIGDMTPGHSYGWYQISVPKGTLEEGKDYVIVLNFYDKDGKHLPLDNSGGDDRNLEDCLRNPAKYKCPAACKETCCPGSGYFFDVISSAKQEYNGWIVVKIVNE